MVLGVVDASHKSLVDAITAKDLPRVEALIKNGANINAQNEYGDSVLSSATFLLQDDAKRYNVIKLLLQRGASPLVLDDERGGPLQNAMLAMDDEMLKLLLDHGADPNEEAGFVADETLYDWAEFDYRYEIYDLQLPETPTAADLSDEDAWLCFLDRLAMKYHRRPPTHLHLLRSYGARRAHELRRDSTSG